MTIKEFFFLSFIISITSASAQINFSNEATLSGLDANCGTSFLGMGVSFCDYDGDGWDDITFATESSAILKFYKNLGGSFFEQTINISGINHQTKQINWVDFDNDGDKDLFITSDVEGNKLFKNEGSLNFTDITAVSGLPTESLFTYGASWGDYNKDGYLDVFLSNRDPNLIIPNFLFKNNGDGTFQDVSNSAGLINYGTLSFCAAFFDYNNDGWQDIYVSKDKVSQENALYSNNGDGTFTEIGEASGTNVAIDAMSTTIGDYNSDGWFDIYVTNGPLGNVFFKNNGDGTFSDIASISGTQFNSVGWGAVFLDAENDSDLDLYVSGSLDGSGSYISAAFYEQVDVDTFSMPSSAGFVGDTGTSYSNAIGDIDNNGFPDIVVNNSEDEQAFLWKNNTISTNNWLKVKLHGTISNRDGIGSIIEISVDGNKQYRYTLSGEGYLAQNSETEFFGLGEATSIDYVKVSWLSGIEDTLYDVNVDQAITIVENSTLSVIDEVQTKTLKIFPNPVSKVFTIKSDDEISRLELHNVLGHIIYKSTVNAKEYVLDIEYLSKGIYFLTLITSNNSIENCRIIKN